jgi:hypothetical protein
MKFMRFLPLLVVALSAGCAKYEYDITRPPELSRHIGTKLDVVLQRDPLEYRLITVENRLVMRIYNPTDAPMTLLGDKSCVVDPSGQSHPLETQSMAPQSFLKLILPPMRPTIEHTGPTFGIGVGTQIGSGRQRAFGWDDFDAFDDEPRYFITYDNSSLYWDWKGESEIRLMLVLQQGEKTFTHDFGIARKKM